MDAKQTSQLARGRECILIEARALEATAAALDDSFTAAVQLMCESLAAGRKIIAAGIGKSGHIAEKIVGTLNSIGSPSCFLDPVNAVHGDLGLCTEGDCALLLSNSGSTDELLRVAPLLKRFGLRTIALTAQAGSPLARACDVALIYRVPAEACPLSLAPTASTTAALAMGDALAMVLLQERRFTREDFARLHPAGNLGRSLLLRVSDVMRTGDRFAHLPDTCTVQQAIVAMTGAKAGCIALVNPADGRLSGVFTDGDFRRCALTSADFLHKPVAEFMTRQPRFVRATALVAEAVRLFEAAHIDDLLALDENDRPIGVLDGQDLPQFRVV